MDLRTGVASIVALSVLLLARCGLQAQQLINVKTAALPNGVTLPYVEQGDANGIPVILLHGVTDSWRSFERLLPLLPETMHVYAITQRGHADASRPESGYQLSDFAPDLRLFLDAMHIDKAVIVGHSMGSGVAQRFALDHPDRVIGLALIGAFARWKESSIVAEFEETAVRHLTDPVDPAFVREFQTTTLAQPVPPEFFEAMVAQSLKVPARVWREAFAGFRTTSMLADLHRITAPTLVIWGEKDAFCPREDQDIFVSTIPNATLKAYEDIGHSPQWEVPERVAADLIPFVNALPK